MFTARYELNLYMQFRLIFALKGLIFFFFWGGGQGAQRDLLRNRPEFSFTVAIKSEFLLLLFQRLLIPENGAQAHRLKRCDPPLNKRYKQSLLYELKKKHENLDRSFRPFRKKIIVTDSIKKETTLFCYHDFLTQPGL